jgi:hypothetical protein
MATLSLQKIIAIYTFLQYSINCQTGCMGVSIWPRDIGVLCIAVCIYCAQCVVTIVIVFSKFRNTFSLGVLPEFNRNLKSSVTLLMSDHRKLQI